MRHYKSKRLGGALAAVALAFGVGGVPQTASAQPSYVGEIFSVGFNFCPRSTAALDGQLLAISSNNALFSLLGTIYGGDGRTTFALPDMRGRLPTHNGTGPGLSPRQIGQRGGSSTKVLLETNTAPHSHNIGAVNQDADKAGPASDLLAKSPGGAKREYHDGPADALMDPGMIPKSPSPTAFDATNPFLTVNWCIVMFGIYPSRS